MLGEKQRQPQRSNPKPKEVVPRRALHQKIPLRKWFSYLENSILVFYNDTVEDAKESLDAWFKWARHCRISAFVELQKKINRHKQSILNTIEYGLTNARIEAINNKIKLSIRMAYGFRNIDNMMAMIMLRCSDIKVQLPWKTDDWRPFQVLCKR